VEEKAKRKLGFQNLSEQILYIKIKLKVIEKEKGVMDD
jgi:hypothetical protein